MNRDMIDLFEVNAKIERDTVATVEQTEQHYRKQLFTLADQIMAKGDIQIVLLAGPSCAGKTTSARLLKEILEERHYNVLTISMDDFFFDRDKALILPNGMKDLDSLTAVNLEQMQNCFTTLFTHGKAMFPEYDFIEGKNHDSVFELTMKDNTIIIFEGLHTLNPELLKHIGTDKFFKVYASTISGFEGDGDHISTRSLRFIRRVVRDACRRGYTPQETLHTWHNVCDAEDKYISPYKEDADAFINTTHEFELNLYRNEFLSLISDNKEILDTLDYEQLVAKAIPLDRAILPDTSLMWEFIDKVKN